MHNSEDVEWLAKQPCECKGAWKRNDHSIFSCWPCKAARVVKCRSGALIFGDDMSEVARLRREVAELKAGRQDAEIKD